MPGELTIQERNAVVTAMLAGYQKQLYAARVNLAVSVGDANGTKQQSELVAQLERGIANVEKEFAADLAFTAAQPPKPQE